jgi:glycosyltransferase-like protein
VHTLALAEALQRSGIDVTVWSLGRGGDTAFFRPVDVPVRLVPFTARDEETVGQRIVRSIAALREAFEPAAYDVVHAQDCISANAVEDCVRTIHHLDTFTTPELAACHERAIVRPRAHVCVSAAVAAEVRAGWGLDPVVIPNGVEAARFASAVPGFGELSPYVLAVGGIEPRKGTLDLIEAMALVREVEPSWRLVVAGGETLFDYRDYRAAVDARAAELGIEPVVLGAVDHEVLPSLVAGARVFAFPSTKEGFGMAAMEALAARVPVVARDLPVLREVFAGAVRFATDPASLAAALLAPADPTRREAGEALCRSHSWDAAAESHVRLYASLT